MSARYVLKRFMMMIPTLLGVSVITFFILRVIPGDPIIMLLPPNATEADVMRLRELYGLTGPIYKQYLIWVRDIFYGNFGTSIHFHLDVMKLIWERLPATIELVVIATVIASILGVAIGTWAIMRRGKLIDKASDAVAVFGLSIPDFLWGLLFILFFGVFFNLFPISGRIDPMLSLKPITRLMLVDSLIRLNFRAFANSLQHIFLPAVALSLPLTAVVIRVIKASLLETANEEYILTARIKGFSELVVIGVHALRNALIPTTTLVGVQFGFLIGGTVLVENIYGWPGNGSLAVMAIVTRDLPLIQGIIIVYSFLFILINFLIDVFYSVLNPKIRYE